MIKTITLDACIEKRVRGKNLDEVQYNIESVNLTSSGVGIKVSRFLKVYGIESHAFIMSASDSAKFIKETMSDKQIPCTILEIAKQGKTNLVLIDEFESCNRINETINIDDVQLKLFSSIIEDKIDEHDVVAFEYNGYDVDVKTMEAFYQILYRKSEVKICDLHPKYWNMLEKNPANVLIVNEQQCMNFFHKSKLPLSQMIELIQNIVVPLAKIVILTLQYNDMLIFVEGRIHRIICNVKNKKIEIFKEAIISGVIKCYEEDGDLKCLSEEIMSISVGTGICSGLYIPNKNTLDLLKEQVVIYSL